MQKIKNAVSLFCAATLLVPSFAMADELPKVIDRDTRHEITQAARQEYMANYDKIAKEMLPTVKVEEVKTQGIDVGRFQRLGAGEPYYVGHGAFVVPENEVRYVTADGKAAFKPRTIVEVPMAPVHGVVSGGRIIEKGMVFWNNRWVALEEFTRYYAHENVRFVVGEKPFISSQNLVSTMEKTFGLSSMRRQLEIKYNSNMFDPVLNEEARKMLVANDTYRMRTAEISIERAGGMRPSQHKIQQARRASIEWRNSAEKVMAKSQRMKSILRYRGFFYKGIFSVAVVAGIGGLELLVSRLDNALCEDNKGSANMIAQSMQERKAMLAAVAQTPELGLWLPIKDKEYVLNQYEDVMAKENLMGAMLEYASFALESQKEGTAERNVLLEVEQQAIMEKELAASLS